MKALITGGAGFIGSNAASRYRIRGDQVVIVDNLSRPGVERNLEWLQKQGVTFEKGDLRDAERVNEVFRRHRDAGLVLHLAGQVAVTSSVLDPRADLETNILGTFNVLESMRLLQMKAPLIFSSTNKVYGEIGNVIERDGRYVLAGQPYGVSEDQPLDFHSPYGCSKGAADQYVRDYQRLYGLRTVVFRQSCIYGYRQIGMEDQGWVAWFMIAAHQNRPITVYGDGKQVRDVLFIDDLLDAFESAAARIDRAAGRIYNIGGGHENVVSLLDVLDDIGREQGRPVPFRHEPWRPGDQKAYVSDIRRAREELGWAPKVGWRRGLELLQKWIVANEELFA
jgi:CDP-paratose 2-epimerase